MKRIVVLFVFCLGFLSIWAQYDMVGEDYGNGLRRVKKGDYYGFIDENGKEVIPVKYFYLEEFTNGKSLVVAGQGTPHRSDNTYGMINKNGEAVVPFKYKEIGFDYGNGLRRVVYHYNYYDVYGFINENGEEVIPVEYKYLDEFSGGKRYVCAQKYDDWNNNLSYAFLINKSGARACPYKVVYRNDNRGGLYVIEDEDGHHGLFDGRTGKIHVNPIYSEIGFPSEGMIRVQQIMGSMAFLMQKLWK